MSEKPGETKQLSFYQIGSVAAKYNPLLDENVMFRSGTNISLGGTSTSQQFRINGKQDTNSLTLNNNNTHNNIHNNTHNNVIATSKVSNTITEYTENEIKSKNGKILQQKPSTPALVLTDMPGYGFAFMNDLDKQRVTDLSVRYLFSNILGGETDRIKENLFNFNEIKSHPKVLKRVLLLLDARHGLKYADIQFFKLLSEQLSTEFSHLKEEIRLQESGDTTITTKKKYINSNNPQIDYSPEAIELRVNEKFQLKLSKIINWKLQIVITKSDLVERNDLCRRIQLITKTAIKQLPQMFHNELPIVILSGYEKKGLLDLQNELSVLVPDKKAMDDEKAKKEKERKTLAYEKYQLQHGTSRVKKSILDARRKRKLLEHIYLIVLS